MEYNNNNNNNICKQKHETHSFRKLLWKKKNPWSKSYQFLYGQSIDDDMLISSFRLLLEIRIRYFIKHPFYISPFVSPLFALSTCLNCSSFRWSYRRFRRSSLLSLFPAFLRSYLLVFYYPLLPSFHYLLVSHTEQILLLVMEHTFTNNSSSVFLEAKIVRVSL